MFSSSDEDDAYDPVEFDPETTFVDDEIDSDTLAFRDAMRDIWSIRRDASSCFCRSLQRRRKRVSTRDTIASGGCVCAARSSASWSSPSGVPMRPSRRRGSGSGSRQWIELTSRHFTLRTDLPRRPGARRAGRLRGRLRDARDGRLPAATRRAIASTSSSSATRTRFRQIAPRGAAGYFMPRQAGRSRSAADHRHPRAHAGRRHAGRDDAAALSPRADPPLPRSSAALDAAVARGGAGRVLLDAEARRAATPSSARCRTPRSSASTSTSSQSLVGSG